MTSLTAAPPQGAAAPVAAALPPSPQESAPAKPEGFWKKNRKLVVWSGVGALTALGLGVLLYIFVFKRKAAATSRPSGGGGLLGSSGPGNVVYDAAEAAKKSGAAQAMLAEGVPVHVKTAHGRYVTATPEGALLASRTVAASEGEVLTIVFLGPPYAEPRSGSKIALRSSSGKYVNGGCTGLLYASSQTTSPGAAETFILYELAAFTPAKYALQLAACGDRWVSFRNEAENFAITTVDGGGAPGAWEMFDATLVPAAT